MNGNKSREGLKLLACRQGFFGKINSSPVGKDLFENKMGIGPEKDLNSSSIGEDLLER